MVKPPDRSSSLREDDQMPSALSLQPGDLLGTRYRIVSRIASGRMGDVFRADDLQLGQPIALRRLPLALSHDRVQSDRLLREVAVARTVAHPYVCRVHDVVEWDGQFFITMEFVSGEDLASLLQRIGRLPPERAVRFARQLVAGLVAMHEHGVLHRDLKPSNILVDDRGRPRLADFGLTVIGSDATGGQMAGTPLYMAPEQLHGARATVQSDLYALGLVLYETFTGRRPFSGDSIDELASARSAGPAMRPSACVEGIPPELDDTIVHCLAPEPGARPRSATALAGSLKSSDLLGIELEAGETPDPALVTAAGFGRTVHPLAALVWFAAIAALVGVVVRLSMATELTNVMPLPMSMNALEYRARAILRELGHDAPFTDSARGWTWHSSYLAHIAATDDTPRRWNRLRITPPSGVLFMYRQSPNPLVRGDGRDPTFVDPPVIEPGMAGVQVDPAGNLQSFYSVPGRRIGGSTAEDPPWNRLFGLAGLAQERFREIAPSEWPSFPVGEMKAWEGTYQKFPDVRLVVEAAASRGRLVFFRILDPWSGDLRARRQAGWTFGLGAMLTLGTVLLLIPFARRNLRLQRADRRTAFRFALASAIAMAGYVSFSWHHAPWSVEELGLIQLGLAWTAYYGIVSWIAYLAVEPYCRRAWPRTMIGWMRLFDGRLRDPQVGRDVLIGVTIGAGVGVLDRLSLLAPGWLGFAMPRPDRIPAFTTQFYVLDGSLPGILFQILTFSLTVPLAGIALLVVARPFFRERQAFAVACALGTLAIAPAQGLGALGYVYTAVWLAIFATAFVRFGLLAMLVGNFVRLVLLVYPMTTDLNTWYADVTLAAFGVIAAMTAFGLAGATKGQRLLPEENELDERVASGV